MKTAYLLVLALLGALIAGAAAQVPYCNMARACDAPTPSGCEPLSHCPPMRVATTQVPVVVPQVVASPVVETMGDPYDAAFIDRPPPLPPHPQPIFIAPPVLPGPPLPPIEIEVPGPGSIAARSAGPDPIVILPSAGGGGYGLSTGGPLIVDATGASSVSQPIPGVTVVPGPAYTPEVAAEVAVPTQRLAPSSMISAGAAGYPQTPQGQYPMGGEQQQPMQPVNIDIRQQQSQQQPQMPTQQSQQQPQMPTQQRQQPPLPSGPPSASLGPTTIVFLDSLENSRVPSETGRSCPGTEFNWTLIPSTGAESGGQQQQQPEGQDQRQQGQGQQASPGAQSAQAGAPGYTIQVFGDPTSIRQIRASYFLNPRLPQDIDIGARSLYWQERKNMQPVARYERQEWQQVPANQQQLPQDQQQQQLPQDQQQQQQLPLDQQQRQQLPQDQQQQLPQDQQQQLPQDQQQQLPQQQQQPLDSGAQSQTQQQSQAQEQAQQGALGPQPPGQQLPGGLPQGPPGQPQQPPQGPGAPPQQPGGQPQQPQQPGGQPQQPSTDQPIFRLPLTDVDLRRGDELWLQFNVLGASGCAADTQLYRVRM